MDDQEQLQIIELKPLPKALVSLIDNSNKIILETQQRLVSEIESSALELMNMLELTYEDGWRLDMENKRWVKVGPIEDPDAS